MTDIRIAVGALFLCPKTSSLLLNLRAPHKSHKLTWGLWGGMLEDGECINECLSREILEEVGFLPEYKLYPFDFFKSKDNTFFHYASVCVVEEEFIPILNYESSGYCWVKVGQWPQPLHYGVKKSFCSAKGKKLLNTILSV